MSDAQLSYFFFLEDKKYIVRLKNDIGGGIPLSFEASTDSEGPSSLDSIYSVYNFRAVLQMGSAE